MFVVTPSGVSLKMTPEGVTTNVLEILFLGNILKSFLGDSRIAPTDIGWGWGKNTSIRGI